MDSLRGSDAAARSGSSLSSRRNPEWRAETASALEASMAAVRIPAALPGMRALTSDEISLLQNSGCTCEDWNRIRTGASADLSGVASCRFEGDVALAPAPGSRITHSAMKNCILAGRIILERTGWIEGYCILDGSVIEDCGRIVFESPRETARGPLLELGVETGERNLRAIPALGVRLAAHLTSGQAGEKDVADYEAALAGFSSFLGSVDYGLIGPSALVRCAPLVENSFICGSCRLDAPGSVRNSILLGGGGEGSMVVDGAIVRSSVLQWSAVVDSAAIVEDSLVCEAARVEKGALLKSSMLGPCSVLGCGEVTASLVGPLCGMHHQSMLIAARWPDGGGNVGYGANVGSNHTSRLPDQEISIGGGVFFGLGSSVKFPSFIAPWTVIATGVVLPPGRIAYPFSLVAQGVAPDPDHPCSLMPGWVLASNFFSVLRNSVKLRSRFCAKRTEYMDCLVSPGTALQVHRARTTLSAVSGKSDFYTSADLPGTGPCTVTEAARIKGIEAYTLYLRWVGLSSLFAGLERGEEPPPACEFDRNGNLCAISAVEFPGESPRFMMEKYLDLIETIKAAVTESRARDYRRGTAVIPDYAGMHSPPSGDEVLLGILGDLDSEAERVSMWLSRRPTSGLR